MSTFYYRVRASINSEAHPDLHDPKSWSARRAPPTQSNLSGQEAVFGKA
jgi:hypothetical protein